MLQKLDKLEEFGVEPAAFARLLRPILMQFVLAFDVTFKEGIPGSGERCMQSMLVVPGQIIWMVGTFCVWDKDGKWQGPNLDQRRVSECVSTFSERADTDDPV